MLKIERFDAGLRGPPRAPWRTSNHETRRFSASETPEKGYYSPGGGPYRVALKIEHYHLAICMPGHILHPDLYEPTLGHHRHPVPRNLVDGTSEHRRTSTLQSQGRILPSWAKNRTFRCGHPGPPGALPTTKLAGLVRRGPPKRATTVLGADPTELY